MRGSEPNLQIVLLLERPLAGGLTVTTSDPVSP